VDEELVSDNIDDELEERGGTPAKTRTSYEYHLALGGPIIKDRAWFYAAYNRFFLDRAVSGQDPSAATEIADFDMFTGKIHVRLTDRDRLVGFGHWSFKQQPYRGLSLTVPPDSALAQRLTTLGGEWQRTGPTGCPPPSWCYFGNEWICAQSRPPPRRGSTPPPACDPDGLGAVHSSRWKPQSTGQINYPHAGRGPRPQARMGLAIDRNGPAWSDASGAIRYLDNSAYGRATSLTDVFVDRIQFANVPNQGETDHNQHTDFFAQDLWRVNDRLSLTLGVRGGRQDIYYGDVANAPLQTDVFAATSAPAADVLERWSVAPRLGVAFDVSGRGKSVLKAFAGRFYANVGSGLEAANPGGRGVRVYQFLDLNTNGLYDGSQELGKLLDARGGGLTQVDPSFELAYSDEPASSSRSRRWPRAGSPSSTSATETGGTPASTWPRRSISRIRSAQPAPGARSGWMDPRSAC
jgi:outer membrane receptor protein involved in Fe transport